MSHAPSRLKPRARTALGAAVAAALALPAAAQAQGIGVSSLGATGGLRIPSAYVLHTGEAAFSFGNEQDPRLGRFDTRQNYSAGFGLGMGLEVYGRIAEYTNPSTVPGLANGIRDLSANLKWQLPVEGYGLPKFAVGATDVAGGATWFKSVYGVASDEYGPLRWTLGLAKSQSNGRPKPLDGLFGGVELKLLNTGATALLETDGTRRFAGLRYYSEPVAWLAGAQLIGSVHRSMGADHPDGRNGDATHFNLSVVVPLGADDALRNARAQKVAKEVPLPPLVQTALQPGGRAAQPAARADGKGAAADFKRPDRPQVANAAIVAGALEDLARVLAKTGLDRIRVGTLDGDVVVEYENQRYLHDELDALGVVLGLAAEHAPAGARRVYAIGLKAGQVMHEASVDVQAYRLWLRDPSEAAAVRATLGFGRLAAYDADGVRWLDRRPVVTNRVRVAVRPLLNHTVATELGLYNYSVAAQARVATTLRPGMQLYADLVQPLANSDDTEPGRAFGSIKHQAGVQNLALQQTFWVNPRVLASVGVGRYQYDRFGAEGEAVWFLPWGEDTVHLRGHTARRISAADLPGARRNDAWSASYRWRAASDTWLEGGIHQYTDGSTGPSVNFTRWFGDVAMNMFAARGGSNTFVGLELSLPLAPREGMKAAPLQFTGARFTTGLRTLLTNGGNTGNYVRVDAVRPAAPAFQLEAEQLNAGRITPDYVRDRIGRLRESFYLHGRSLLPN